ncbi:MAG TPA: chemotaxis protein CheA [Solirubrobacteraceae bacterium]|jgi:two-component system chemotaxis sensor kinase CheA|nr:chemotaxis protein CheA [Solirubrobacteraceae bacterium]
MDTSEYMPMFLAEAKEHLQELNLAVVALEEDSQDRETVDEIFRIAHSLKGMSATMGFAQIAKLTHEMEDVFELLRQRTEALPREAIDTVLACLDALSGAFDAIEANGEESLDPTPLVERLHGLVRARTAEQEVDRAGGAEMPDLVAATAAGERVLHVVAVLDDRVMMPAVRAHMVFAALGEHGELIGGVPSTEEVELFSGKRIEAWLTSEHEEEAVARTVSGVSDIVAVEIGEVAAPHAAPDPAPAVQPAVAEPAGAPAAVPTANEPAAPAAAEAPAQPAAAEAPKAPAAPAKAASATKTVRIDAERLDALMHSMGELVIHRTAVEALTSNLDVPGLQQAMQDLTRSSQALQSMVMQVRMIPVDVVFLRFPRLVRDLSGKLGKEVKLDLVGSETELDRTVVDALGDPLVHLVRNSLDHGLEPPAERRAAGKSDVGTLEIAARHAGGSVVIEVRDDGRGINPEMVARKALERGLIDPQAAADINMKSAVELLFAPGFSTAEATSDISGRGVGMDAVRARIRELGGEVLIDSVQGEGTLAQIRLPLTLAIVSALQVEVAGGSYAVPLNRVERTLRLSEQMVRSVAGRRMLVLDDGVLQLLEGATVFGRTRTAEHDFVVIVRAQDQRLALSVDDLIGQRELVTRPLPPVVSSGEPVSGGAALADGRIALIVDCDALSSLARPSDNRELSGRGTSDTSVVTGSGRVAA